MSKPTVVITGGSSGIGRALVEAYLERGCRVASIDVAGAPAGETSPDLLTVIADVTDESRMLEAAREIRATLGQPSVWINNAGIARLGSFDSIPSSDFQRVIAVNFFGVVHGTRAALEVMREPESGTIVNVASMNGKVPAPFMSSYVAAKHAVVGFTKSLQQEKKQQQSPLRVSLVCPGWVRTPIMDTRDGFEFPSWLGWAVESPRRAALEIIAGIEAGKDEITPTWNGRLIRGAHAVAPGLVESSTRLLTAKSWKEALGLSRIRK